MFTSNGGGVIIVMTVRSRNRKSRSERFIGMAVLSICVRRKKMKRESNISEEKRREAGGTVRWGRREEEKRERERDLL